MRPPHDLQRGVAVLTAMLVVTLGTMIAVNMMWSASLDQRRASAGLAADQGLAYLQGAEAWAGDILRQDRVDSPPKRSPRRNLGAGIAPPARGRRRHQRPDRRPSRQVQP